MVSAANYNLNLYVDSRDPSAAVNRVYARARAGRVDLVRTMDMGAHPRPATSTSTAVRDGNKKQYLKHLTGTFWTAHFVVLACGAIAGMTTINLLVFLLEGTSIIHPLLSIFILVAVCSLIVVAFISIRTSVRYFRWVDRES